MDHLIPNHTVVPQILISLVLIEGEDISSIMQDLEEVGLLDLASQEVNMLPHLLLIAMKAAIGVARVQAVAVGIFDQRYGS